MSAFLLALEGLNRAFKVIAEVADLLKIIEQEPDPVKAGLRAALRFRGIAEKDIDWFMGELSKLEFDPERPGALHNSVNYLVATIVERGMEVTGWQG